MLDWHSVNFSGHAVIATIMHPKFDGGLQVTQTLSLPVHLTAPPTAARPERRHPLDGRTPNLAARTFSRDTSDDAFIHAAAAAQTDWLVTSDRDLLTVGPLEDLRIVTPKIALGDASNIPEQL